jgi:thioredoxin reductase (NADPH)
MTIENVIVIGAGPSGFTAAIYLARAGLNPVVLAGEEPGGALATTTDVENFPGFVDGIDGPELMENMEAQAKRFGARIVYATATGVDLARDVKTVTTDDGMVYQAHAVVLSTGSEYRKLGVDGEIQLSGHGVSYCATCDGVFFRDQHVAVAGGGDSALEEALFLARFCATVTVLVRGNELRASKVVQDRAHAEPKINFLFGHTVAQVIGDTSVTGVIVTDAATPGGRVLPVTGLFIAVGHTPRSDLFDAEVAVDDAGYVEVKSPTTLTSVAGVFACGDLVDSRYRQAITAAGTGCAAALDAERYLAAIA